MRTLQKNKQKLHYATPTGNKIPIYELDENGHRIVSYVDGEGNVYYVETGDSELAYDDPVEFLANIALSGGEAEAQEFGLSIADYNAVIVADVNKYPIVNGTLIWHESPVKYKDAEQTMIDAKSADYMVLKVSKSINVVRYVLTSVVK